MDAELFRAPPLNGTPDPAGWHEERLAYRVSPRPKSKFKTILDAHALFGNAQGSTQVTTRVREAREGEPCLTLDIAHRLRDAHLSERLECVAERGAVRCDRLLREVRDADGQPCRRKEIAFRRGPFDLPAATYPEVLLPFLMRGQPQDGKVRAAYSWTSDRFVARVYYESRGRSKVEVPAGRFDVVEVWMYPDLNDWVALGSVLTKLAKPLLPRYSLWFEAAPPYRTVRFEGPYGPPAAPEVILELEGVG